jgi:hypothetical protein
MWPTFAGNSQTAIPRKAITGRCRESFASRDFDRQSLQLLEVNDPGDEGEHAEDARAHHHASATSHQRRPG